MCRSTLIASYGTAIVLRVLVTDAILKLVQSTMVHLTTTKVRCVAEHSFI